MTIEKFDAVIVGARCAGASTAMLLARQGARVLLVDRAEPGSDTLSTHAIMRGGVTSLHRWGLLDQVISAGTPPVRTSTFHYEGSPVEVAIKPRDGVDALFAPRRTVLDPILANAASEAGATLRYRTTLESLKTRKGRVTGAVLRDASGLYEVASKIVIGADGIRSRVAQLANAEITQAANHATASIYGYVHTLPDTGFHTAFSPGSAAGVIPTNNGAHCVFVSFAKENRGRVMANGTEAAFRGELEKTMPWAVEQICAEKPKLYAFGGVRGYLRRAFGPGWALVGDAGYFKDTVTAHGITDAFRDAELLARAVSIDSAIAYEDYRNLRDALSLPLMRITDRIASCTWRIGELQMLHAQLNQATRTEAAVMASMNGEDDYALPQAA